MEHVGVIVSYSICENCLSLLCFDKKVISTIEEEEFIKNNFTKFEEWDKCIWYYLNEDKNILLKAPGGDSETKHFGEMFWQDSKEEVIKELMEALKKRIIFI